MRNILLLSLSFFAFVASTQAWDPYKDYFSFKDKEAPAIKISSYEFTDLEVVGSSERSEGYYSKLQVDDVSLVFSFSVYPKQPAVITPEVCAAGWAQRSGGDTDVKASVVNERYVEASTSRVWNVDTQEHSYYLVYFFKDSQDRIVMNSISCTAKDKGSFDKFMASQAPSIKKSFMALDGVTLNEDYQIAFVKK